MGWTTEESEFSIRHWQKLSLVFIGLNPALDSTYRGSFLGGKAPGREANHSLLSSVEVKNTWSYTSAPSYVFTS
jgi:hypothetical protein